MHIDGIEKDFPEDAVKHYSKGHVLQRVTGPDGRILWSQPPPVVAATKRADGGKFLPPPIETTLRVLLGNAQFQTVRDISRNRQEYFFGYLMGMQEAIGIFCGALGYNVDFLVSEEALHDDGHRNNPAGQIQGSPKVDRAREAVHPRS